MNKSLSGAAPRLHPLTAFFALVWYWCWGGIIEASRVGQRIKDSAYTQFHLSFLTMIIGVVLIAPGEMWTPLSRFLQFYMPEAAWGVVFLVAGRISLHAMTSATDCRAKCNAAGVLMGCWTFLTFITLCSSGVSLGSVAFAYITWRAGALMKSLCKPNC